MNARSIPPKRIRPAVGRCSPRDLDQRRLAGAIVPQERNHFAGRNGKRYAPQRLDRPEALADVGQFEKPAARPRPRDFLQTSRQHAGSAVKAASIEFRVLSPTNSNRTGAEHEPALSSPPMERPDANFRRPAAYEEVDGAESSRVLFLCDHATNIVPPEIGGGTLGLPPEEMGRHIAYDIGARGVTLELAGLMAAPAVLSRFSRLVIDPNRGKDDPTLVMRLYDGTNHPRQSLTPPRKTWERRLDRLAPPLSRGDPPAPLDRLRDSRWTRPFDRLDPFLHPEASRPEALPLAGRQSLWHNDGRIALAAHRLGWSRGGPLRRRQRALLGRTRGRHHEPPRHRPRLRLMS